MSRILTARDELGQDLAREKRHILQNDDPPAPGSAYDESLAKHRRLELVRRHGNFTLAYSTAVQPELLHFFSDGGYVAYMTKWGYVHVLGDPVVAAENRPGLLDAFLHRFPRAGFYQISFATARDLEARRFYVNEMGVDYRLDLPNYNFDGKSKEFLRYASNWLMRRGFRVEERRYGEFSPSELLELDARWKSTRRIKAEVRFLNRPISLDQEPDVRRFFLFDSSGTMRAFVFFDPIYTEGKVVGYATAFKRRDTLTNGYVEPGIMRTAIEVFQREGYQTVRLGLSPMAHIENLEFRKNWFLHHSFRYAFNAWWVNRFFYNLQGHAAFKQRFCGVEEKTYFASRSLTNDLRIAGMLRLCRII